MFIKIIFVLGKFLVNICFVIIGWMVGMLVFGFFIMVIVIKFDFIIKFGFVLN